MPVAKRLDNSMMKEDAPEVYEADAWYTGFMSDDNMSDEEREYYESNWEANCSSGLM